MIEYNFDFSQSLELFNHIQQTNKKIIKSIPKFTILNLYYRKIQINKKPDPNEFEKFYDILICLYLE